MRNTHFEMHRDSLEREIKNLNEYKVVNDFLRSHNWLFISPLFFQGFELKRFYDLSKEKGNREKEVKKIIFRKFFNLDWSASFIDGYCNRCNHIKPFLLSIEHSLILTFQRDYEGGIKTLLPIVEGILRRYLNIEKGIEMKNIRFQHLTQSIVMLRDQSNDDFKSWLNHYVDENNRKIIFTEEEKDILVTLEEEYNAIWFSFISEFIDKSLYLNTSKKEITNEVNRHAILHEYGLDIEYNLENYIKIYFVIHFLTWIFLKKEGKSLFAEIKPSRFEEKALAYKNILELSKKTYYDKHVLYRNKKNYNPNLLQEEINFIYTEPKLPIKYRVMYSILKRGSRFFWNKFGIEIGHDSKN